MSDIYIYIYIYIYIHTHTYARSLSTSVVDCVWNVMAHAQKPDFVFRRKGRVHLNRQGRQFSQILAAEVCTSVVVMLDTPSSEVMWRVLTTHSIRQFPLHFPSRASPCAIAFELDSTQTHTTLVLSVFMSFFCVPVYYLMFFVAMLSVLCVLYRQTFNSSAFWSVKSKVKVSGDRPRWSKGFRVG